MICRILLALRDYSFDSHQISDMNSPNRGPQAQDGAGLEHSEEEMASPEKEQHQMYVCGALF
jgi:hypothetical protein